MGTGTGAATNTVIPDEEVQAIPDSEVQLEGPRTTDLKTGAGMEDAAREQAHTSGNKNVKYMGGGLTTDPYMMEHPPTEGINELHGALEGAEGMATLGTAGQLITNPLVAARGLIGSSIGAGLGTRGGESVGGLFGDEGKKIGGTIGAVGGGLLGGGLAAGLERQPTTALQSMRGRPGSISSLPFGIQRAIPEWMVPTGERGSLTNTGEFMDIPPRMPNQKALPAPVDELSQAIREGRAARIPTRMPAKIAPPATPDELSLAVREGRASRIPTRMPRSITNITSLPGAGTTPESVAGTRSLVLTPSEASSEEVMQAIAKRRASERGMQFAGGMTPREGRKVPRLPGRLPEEEYPKPRSVTRLSDDY